MAADKKRLTELGMVPPLATWVGNMIDGTATKSAVKLMEMSMPRTLAVEVVRQMVAAVGNADMLSQLGMSPRLAGELATQISGGTAPTLGSITASPNTATQGAAYSGTTTGRTPGSTLSLTGAGSTGLSINSTTGDITGTPSATGAVNIVEALAGATNTPNTSSGAINVAAAGAMIPAQGNLVAHWDAQAIPPQSDETTITDWTDSINGLTVTQATPANRPWYRTNSIGGGKPSVEFRADQSMTVTSTGTALKTTIDSQVYTVMVIMTNGSITVSTGTPFSTAPTNAGLIILNQGTLVGTYNGYLRATTVHNQFYTFGVSSHATRGSRLYIDGGIIGQDSAQAQPTNSSTFSIGKIQGQGANTGLRGFVAEILIWDRQLTPVEALQLDDYARDTYGQTNPRASGDFWIYDGDSITAGIGATVVRDNYPRYASQGKSLIYGQWTNVAIGGFTWISMTNKAAEIDDIVTYLSNPVNLAVWEFYNSRAIGSLISTYVVPYLQDRYAAGVSRIVFGTTCDYTGAGVEKTNYDAYWDTPANRVGLMDAYVPIHLNANIGVDGSSASSTYFADGIHLTGLFNYPTVQSGYGVLGELFAAEM